MHASVSNLDLFRVWKQSPDLDLDWILNRILFSEQTEAMRAGQAFHKALEGVISGELEELQSGPYRFCFLCDYELQVPRLREMRLSKRYGELVVRGRVDSIDGRVVQDYKTTERFDADRLMEGYQWRFYLDMAEADRLKWTVFEMYETPESPGVYVIHHVHDLEQFRYPTLHSDCVQLAAEYAQFSREHLEPRRALGKTDLEIKLEKSIEQAKAKKAGRPGAPDYGRRY